MDSLITKGINYSTDNDSAMIEIVKPIVINFKDIPDGDESDIIRVALTDEAFLKHKVGENSNDENIAPTVAPVMSEILSVSMHLHGLSNDPIRFQHVFGDNPSEENSITYGYRSYGLSAYHSRPITSLFRLNDVFDEVTFARDDNSAGGTPSAVGKTIFSNLHGVTPKLIRANGDHIFLDPAGTILTDLNETPPGISEIYFIFELRNHYSKYELGYESR